MSIVPDRTGNALLDRLPARELGAARPYLEIVSLSHGQVLYPGNAEEELTRVYFPTTAVASMLTLMADGSAVEAAAVGCEGIIGVQSALGGTRILERSVCQIPGEALRLDSGGLRACLKNSATLRVVMQRYLHSYLSFLAQSAACNRLHLLVERCARWLLLTHDRVRRDDFPLTHEFLALMLGVRRTDVTLAAATLQKAGFIRYTRGTIQVADRGGLESASCECYEVTTREYARIFSAPISPADGNE